LTVADWLNDLEDWNDSGPVAAGMCNGGCIQCRDCRRGFLLDISAILPTIGTTYTRSLGGVDNAFKILEYSWGLDAESPIFVGTMADESGALVKRCCERVIGTCVIEYTNEEVGALAYGMGFLVVGVDAVTPSALTPNNHRVYFKISLTNNAADTYVFSFVRSVPTGTGHNVTEKTLCHVPRGVWTDLGNALEADYETGKAYLVEYETAELPIMPAYCNSDGEYINQGLSPAAPSPTTDAYECACSSCYGPSSHTLTISGFEGLCVVGMTAETDALEMVLDLSGTAGVTCGQFLSDSFEDRYPVEQCGTDSCFQVGEPASELVIFATIDFNFDGYPGEGDSNVRITFVATFICGDPEDGITYQSTSYAYFKWACGGGIIPGDYDMDVDFDGTTGTLNVAIAAT